MSDFKEYRTISQEQTELRAEEDGRPRLLGYASVFNSRSQDLGGFTEIVKPGAFTKSLKDGRDVVALFNHDHNNVLGRVSNGTLELSEDAHGLRAEIFPDVTTDAGRNVLANVKRKDVTQMSFGFQTVKDRMRSEGDTTIRELIEVRLFDVSPVTFPAYTSTEIQARVDPSAQERASRLLDPREAFDVWALDGLEEYRGRGLTDPEILARFREVIERTPESAPGLDGGTPVEMLRRRLDLDLLELEGR